MSTVEMDKLELEVKRARDIGLNLANQVNDRIDEITELRAVKNSLNAQLVEVLDENAELKSELARLNNLILTMEIQ